MNPESEVIADSSELNPAAAEQLDELVQLLVDLEVMDAPAIEAPGLEGETTGQGESADQSFTSWLRLDSLPAAHQTLPPSIPAHPEIVPASPLLLPCSQSDVMHRGLYNFPFLYPLSSEPSDEVSELPLPQGAPDAPLAEDALSAFQRLQALLVGPELSQLQDLDATVAEKLARVEHQIYDREALIQLLLPTIAELLSRKVEDAEDDLVQAIAPIIDQVIQTRAQTNQTEMGLVLAPLLPVSITEQVDRSPESMATAIAPVMGLAIKKQLELDQDIVVDALYPIIGGTIAKYFAEMMRAINQKLEQALSPVGLRRKIQAKLQGVSEAELILREAMPFKVQTLFLIHKLSGLVIAEVHRENHETLEIDMVAGMLTAIRSFVNDCFARSGSISELDQIDYGTSKIILEAAGFCYLAVVVEGDPPSHWIQQVRAWFRNLNKEYGEPLAEFDGDPATVPPALVPQLSGLLDIDPAEPPRSGGRFSPLMLLGGGILGLIVIPWGIHFWISNTHQRAETAAMSALMAEPSLSVYHVTTQVQQGRLRLSGRLPNATLRQRAEQIVRATVPAWPIDNQILTVDVPPDPELTKAEVQRAMTFLNQLDGITITAQYDHDRVSVTGDVMQATQVVQVTKAFAQIPGVKTVSSAISVQPWQLNIRFYFPIGSAALNAVDHTTKLLVIRNLLKQYPKLHLNLVGYATPRSSTKGDLPLAEARARAVQSVLIQQGIQPDRLHVSGRVELPPEVAASQPTWLSRCVVLELFEPSR
jgi:outer membrane protein OmpA-like peptidoglycan-associated protein